MEITAREEMKADKTEMGGVDFEEKEELSIHVYTWHHCPLTIYLKALS